MPFPHYIQQDAMDCGSTSLRIVCKYYGKTFSAQTLRDRSYITREGVSMLGISDAAESLGLRTMGGDNYFSAVAKRYPSAMYCSLEAESFFGV
jgi:ABC-type bacteriocin/lantibiotic exporter with double-glycine peptidase domain